MHAFGLPLALSTASETSSPRPWYAEATSDSSTPINVQPYSSQTEETRSLNCSESAAQVTTFVKAFVSPKSVGGVSNSTRPIQRSFIGSTPARKPTTPVVLASSGAANNYALPIAGARVAPTPMIVDNRPPAPLSGAASGIGVQALFIEQEDAGAEGQQHDGDARDNAEAGCGGR